MKRWTIFAVFVLVCLLTSPVTADTAPNEITTNPNIPTPVEGVLDWLGSLWHAVAEALAQDPKND